MPILPRAIAPSPVRPLKAREPGKPAKETKPEQQPAPKPEAKSAQEKYYEYRYKKEVAEDVAEIVDLLILTGKKATRKSETNSPWGG